MVDELLGINRYYKEQAFSDITSFLHLQQERTLDRLVTVPVVRTLKQTTAGRQELLSLKYLIQKK